MKGKANMKKKVVTTIDPETEEQEKMTDDGPTPTTVPQFLTADDILTSCGSPVEWKVPELSRNGKPAIVLIRRPSFDAMNSFWSRRENDKNKKTGGEETVDTNDSSKTRSNNIDEASALMRFLLVSEDGTTPLFTDEQVSHIREARFDVFRRLQEGIDSVIRPIINDATEVSTNPFEEKEETN